MHNPWKMAFFALLGLSIFFLAMLAPLSAPIAKYWWIAELLVVGWFFYELNHSRKPSSPSANP